MSQSKRISWGSFAVFVPERLSAMERLSIAFAIASIMLWTFPHVSLAQSAENVPLEFEANNISIFQMDNVLQEDYLAKALAPDVPPEPVDPRIELLRQYLMEKKSPMAQEPAVLLKQYHYRLIIGIAFAESNFCKIQIRPNNCWGIGGSYPEKYPTLKDGIIRANNLIERYHDQGMTTPKLMRNTWVGWQNHSWPIAVMQVTTELENRGL